MKKITTILALGFLVAYPIFSQTFDLQFVEITNDASIGGAYEVKIQIRGSSEFGLATSNITFDFNGAALSDPTLVTAHYFSGVYGSAQFIYNAMSVTEPLTDQVASINISFTQSATYVDNVPTIWKDVATVGFTIDNTSETTNLQFRSSDPSFTAVYKYSEPEFTRLSAGTWFGLDAPLPVELSTFNVNSVEGTKAQLQWETATEVNNYGFEIERAIAVVDSEEEAVWEMIAFIEGHGNSNSPKVYSFTDKNLVGGSKFMYRLKQIDIDGKFEYTDAVEVEVLPTKYELFQNYPNPFNPSTKIKFSLPEDTKLSINIYNLLGEKVATLLNKELKAGFHQVEFTANSAGYSLASGVYIYSIESANFTQVKKLILMK